MEFWSQGDITPRSQHRHPYEMPRSQNYMRFNSCYRGPGNVRPLFPIPTHAVASLTPIIACKREPAYTTWKGWSWFDPFWYRYINGFIFWI